MNILNMDANGSQRKKFIRYNFFKFYEYINIFVKTDVEVPFFYSTPSKTLIYF